MIITVYEGTWKDRTGTHVRQPILYLPSESSVWASVPDIPVLTGKVDQKGGWYRATDKLKALLAKQFTGSGGLSFVDRGTITL